MRPSLLLVVLSSAAITASCARGGCGGATCPFAETIDLVVTTDKTVYSLSADTSAQPILVNRGDGRVYLPMNEYVYVQRFGAGAWSNPEPWFSVDGTGVSFPLEPGDTLRAHPMSFSYVDRQVGVYRFMFEIAADPNGRTILHESMRVTAPFEIQP